MAKWEYRFVCARRRGDHWYPVDVDGQQLSEAERQQTLATFANRLGQDGWELVFMNAVPVGGRSGGGSHDNLPGDFVFKRPQGD